MAPVIWCRNVQSHREVSSQASAVHADLAKRLTELEFTTERLELSHDTFSRNTRNQLRQVFETLRELAEKVTPPEPPKRPLGFVTHEDKPSKSGATKTAIKVGRSKKT